MPEPMKNWVDGQADSGRYSDASDYIRDLIRRDQERAAKIAHMQKLVDEGLASGISEETMDDILHSLQDAAEYSNLTLSYGSAELLLSCIL
jgi:antitoxin ParD1/3/4